MLPILQKTSRLFLIVAIFVATGGHWAVLQSVAWSAMLVKYSREAGLGSAVEQTFDGRHPCSLCKKIARNQQEHKKPDTQVATAKLEFLYQPGVPLLLQPEVFWQLSSCDTFSPAFAQQPPVPPPRGIRA